MDEVFHAHVARIADLIYEVAQKRQHIRLEFSWLNEHKSEMHAHTFTTIVVSLTDRSCEAKVYTRNQEDITREERCVLWNVQEDGDIYAMLLDKNQSTSDYAQMLLAGRMTRLYECVKNVMDKAYPKEALT